MTCDTISGGTNHRITKIWCIIIIIFSCRCLNSIAQPTKSMFHSKLAWVSCKDAVVASSFHLKSNCSAPRHRLNGTGYNRAHQQLQSSCRNPLLWTGKASCPRPGIPTRGLKHSTPPFGLQTLEPFDVSVNQRRLGIYWCFFRAAKNAWHWLAKMS